LSVDIAYIVSHGFAARMVMQTNLLGRLSDLGMDVALIAPDKDDANLKTYCHTHNIQLHQFNPQTDFWTANYVKARMYFLENIKKNPALYEKYIYAKNYVQNQSFNATIKLLLFKLGHDLKEVFPVIKTIFKRREQKMLRSCTADELIQLLKPKVLVSTYPVNYSESMLVKSAQTMGIKTVMHLLSWDNISCKGHFPVLAEEYIAWGPIMKEELKEYYNIKDAKIRVTGVPHFDLHTESKKTADQGRYLQELGLDPKKPYLFFGMSSPRFAPKEIDIVEHLAEQIAKNVYGKNLQLVVRPHPQNIQGSMSDTSWLPRLKKLKSARVGVDFPKLATSNMAWSMEKNDMYKLSSLLVGAVLSLNSGSTLSIDSMMCGTPVILTSFDGASDLDYWKSAKRLIDYNHLKKLITLDGVEVCKSYVELESTIHYITKNRSKVSDQVTNSVQRFCYSSGSATENVAKVLLQMINKKSDVSA